VSAPGKSDLLKGHFAPSGSRAGGARKPLKRDALKFQRREFQTLEIPETALFHKGFRRLAG